MEYPPVKPHLIAIHELRKDYLYDKFKTSFDKVMHLAGDDPFAQLEVCYQYYKIYATMGNKREDVEHVEKKAGEIVVTDSTEFTVLHLLLKAYRSLRLRNMDAFQEQIDSAFSLLDKKSGDLYFEALILKYSPHLYALNKFNETIKGYKEIIQHAGNLFDTIGFASIQLGIVYCTLNENDEAEAAFQHALKIYQQLGYKSDIAIAYSNLSVVANLRFEQSETEDQANEHLQEAIYYTELAVELMRQCSITRDLVITLSNLGLLYAYLKNTTVAVQYGAEALSIARTKMTSFDIAIGLLQLGNIHQIAGQYSESLALLEECIPYTKPQANSLPFPAKAEIEMYAMLSHASHQLGLFEKSCTYGQTYITLLKEFDKKTKEGSIYHNKLLQQQLRQQEEEYHQLQLRSLEEKMRSQATQLVSQAELLAKFRDELREIARQYAGDHPGMRAVKEKLKQLPCSQIDWAKFEGQFNEVHPDFRSKLAEQFPELTEMEQRIAVMVRMDLKSVDIAKLFCITERAIEFHRLNMRKKLGLASGETLPKFLKSI